MVAEVDGDSPLSTIANIAGILTFLVALLAAAYARITYLRNSDEEYFRVKASLLWYKTESDFLRDLVQRTNCDGKPQSAPEKAMSTFVMEDLRNLEARLLELVAEIERRAVKETVDDGGRRERGGDDPARGALNGGRKGWALVPRSWGFTTEVAVSWLPVRAKALELVRQRDALTARVLFTQMSMVSLRIRELEERIKFDESKTDASFRHLEDVIHDQRTQIHRLEDLVYRLMHQDKVNRDEARYSFDASSSTGLPGGKRSSLFRHSSVDGRRGRRRQVSSPSPTTDVFRVLGLDT